MTHMPLWSPKYLIMHMDNIKHIQVHNCEIHNWINLGNSWKLWIKYLTDFYSEQGFFFINLYIFFMHNNFYLGVSFFHWSFFACFKRKFTLGSVTSGKPGTKAFRDLEYISHLLWTRFRKPDLHLWRTLGLPATNSEQKSL